MNTSPMSNGHAPYQIEAAETVWKEITTCQVTAIHEGRGPEFALAIRQLLERLRSNPNQLGEELYRLPALRLRIRCAIIRPIYVDCGVSEDRQIVYIRSVRLLANTGAR